QPDPGDQSSPDTAATGGAEVEQALAKLSADRERLEERLTALARENRKLKAEQASPDNDAGAETARLREQMSELAADVVYLTAMLEGPASPITKVLEGSDGRSEGPRPSL